MRNKYLILVASLSLAGSLICAFACGMHYVNQKFESVFSSLPVRDTVLFTIMMAFAISGMLIGSFLLFKVALAKGEKQGWSFIPEESCDAFLQIGMTYEVLSVCQGYDPLLGRTMHFAFLRGPTKTTQALKFESKPPNVFVRRTCEDGQPFYEPVVSSAPVNGHGSR